MVPCYQSKSHGILVFLAMSMVNVLGREVVKNQYQVYDRSVWASGQNARVHMERFKKLPVVTWTKQAEDFIKDRWQAVQHRATCERVIWMTPWFWGKTSQLRDWLDYAIVSVFTYNRTIIDDYNYKSYANWCPDGNWLNCYYEPFKGTQCNGVRRQGPQASSIKQFGGEHNFLQAKSYCASNSMEIHQAFPNAMWDKLVAAKQIVYRNADTWAPMDITAVERLKKNDAYLYYSVSLSSLKSIIAKRILIIKEDIRRKANAFTQNISKEKTVIAVHMRRTDKHIDHGADGNLEFSDRFATKAIGMICGQYFPSDGEETRYDCLERLPHGIPVLALSDDTSAIVDLKRHLGPKFNVHTLSNISKLLHTDAERKEYNKIGHKFFSSPSPRTFEYHASVFVDIAAASQADMLIGVGGSGVSQIIAQMIGGKKRADGNVFSLWQEDLQADAGKDLTGLTEHAHHGSCFPNLPHVHAGDAISLLCLLLWIFCTACVLWLGLMQYSSLASDSLAN